VGNVCGECVSEVGDTPSLYLPPSLLNVLNNVFTLDSMKVVSFHPALEFPIHPSLLGIDVLEIWTACGVLHAHTSRSLPRIP
jgi:hypothetical protein